MRKPLVPADSFDAARMTANDPVNHPSHYTFGKIEAIDAIEDWQLNYHRAYAVKYIMRAGKKDPKLEVQDLQKATWYLSREIGGLKKQNG